MIRVSSNGGSMKESKQSFTQCIHSGALQTSDLIMHTHKRTEWPRPWSLLALTGQINLRVCRRNIHTHSYTAAWALAVQLIRKRDKRVESLNEGGSRVRDWGLFHSPGMIQHSFVSTSPSRRGFCVWKGDAHACCVKCCTIKRKHTDYLQ